MLHPEKNVQRQHKYNLLPNSLILAAYVANNVQLNLEIENKMKKPACLYEN